MDIHDLIQVRNSTHDVTTCLIDTALTKHTVELATASGPPPPSRRAYNQINHAKLSNPLNRSGSSSLIGNAGVDFLRRNDVPPGNATMGGYSLNLYYCLVFEDFIKQNSQVLLGNRNPFLKYDTRMLSHPA